MPEDAFYHVYEMNLDGSGRRQLTHGRYDDFDARYLPERRHRLPFHPQGAVVQCSKANTAATVAADLPDSYVRCGGDNYRPVPVFTLHAMDADGERSASDLGLRELRVDARGGQRRPHPLHALGLHRPLQRQFLQPLVHQSRRHQSAVGYSNYTVRPQVEVRGPLDPQLAETGLHGRAHHSNIGGSLILLDRSRGTEEAVPIVRLTPESPFPETEASVDAITPIPIRFPKSTTSWPGATGSCRRTAAWTSTEQNPINATGMYLYDAFGNLNLLYRDPADFQRMPDPRAARPRPPAYASTVQWDGQQEGSFLLQDVYEGMPGVPGARSSGCAWWGCRPRTQPHMNQPNLGVSGEDPGKYVLGTVPVEADGSAYFRVPVGRVGVLPGPRRARDWPCKPCGA